VDVLASRILLHPGDLEASRGRSAPGRRSLAAEIRVDAREQPAAEPAQRPPCPQPRQPAADLRIAQPAARRTTVRSPSPPGVSVRVLTNADPRKRSRSMRPDTGSWTQTTCSRWWRPTRSITASAPSPRSWTP
jgi:hypothetical protein